VLLVAICRVRRLFINHELKGKGRQRQQGKRRRKKFQCHMIVRQWVLEARPHPRRTALPHKLEAKERFHFQISTAS